MAWVYTRIRVCIIRVYIDHFYDFHVFNTVQPGLPGRRSNWNRQLNRVVLWRTQKIRIECAGYRPFVMVWAYQSRSPLVSSFLTRQCTSSYNKDYYKAFCRKITCFCFYELLIAQTYHQLNMCGIRSPVECLPEPLDNLVDLLRWIKEVSYSLGYYKYILFCFLTNISKGGL